MNAVAQDEQITGDTMKAGVHITGTGDFDGNGQSDILWHNSNGAVSVWDNGQIGGAHIIANPGIGHWHVADVGDYDGNGLSDILWRIDNGRRRSGITGRSAVRTLLPIRASSSMIGT